MQIFWEDSFSRANTSVFTAAETGQPYLQPVLTGLSSGELASNNLLQTRNIAVYNNRLVPNNNSAPSGFANAALIGLNGNPMPIETTFKLYYPVQAESLATRFEYYFTGLTSITYGSGLGVKMRVYEDVATDKWLEIVRPSSTGSAYKIPVTSDWYNFTTGSFDVKLTIEPSDTSPIGTYRYSSYIYINNIRYQIGNNFSQSITGINFQLAWTNVNANTATMYSAGYGLTDLVSKTVRNKIVFDNFTRADNDNLIAVTHGGISEPQAWGTINGETGIQNNTATPYESLEGTNPISITGNSGARQSMYNILLSDRYSNTAVSDDYGLAEPRVYPFYKDENNYLVVKYPHIQVGSSESFKIQADLVIDGIVVKQSSILSAPVYNNAIINLLPSDNRQLFVYPYLTGYRLTILDASGVFGDTRHLDLSTAEVDAVDGDKFAFGWKDVFGTKTNNQTQGNFFRHIAIASIDPDFNPPTTFITGNREEENNRALLSCNITIPDTSLWTSTVLQYKLTDLDSDWVTLRNLPSSSTVVYHTNPEGYFSNGDLLYRLKTIYNGEEYFSNGLLLAGDNIARYNTTKTVEDFKVENIIYNEAANQLQVTFRYPRPTTLSSTIPRRPQFRITDVETGRVYGSSPSSNGLNTVLSSFLYEETGPALFSSELQSTPNSKMVYTLNVSVDPTAPIIREFISGRKGVRLEWGWTPLIPNSLILKTFTLDSNNYGQLIFYPNIGSITSELPPEGEFEFTPDSEQDGTGGPGQIQTPAGGTGDTGGGNSGNTGVGVVDPIDIAPVIIVTPITDGQICLTDAEGVNLACGILPDGTPPNPFITIRKENDNIFIIYDGRVVVSYKIDPVTFPNLTNSQGWVGFFDLETEEQIDAPEGSIVSWLPEEGSDYEVSPEETEYGMSRKRPFIYGTYQQGYTLIINGTSVSVEMEPLHDDLVAADFYISGGTTVQVTPEIATIIANAGYGRYLSVVR